MKSGTLVPRLSMIMWGLCSLKLSVLLCDPNRPVISSVNFSIQTLAESSGINIYVINLISFFNRVSSHRCPSDSLEEAKFISEDRNCTE